MAHRFRTAFFKGNLLLVVLGLLQESELSEREILDSLHSRYGVTPSMKEFRRLSELIVNGGYIMRGPADGTQKLRLSRSGTRLLKRLEDEYKAIMSGADASRPILTR